MVLSDELQAVLNDIKDRGNQISEDELAKLLRLVSKDDASGGDIGVQTHYIELAQFLANMVEAVAAISTTHGIENVTRMAAEKVAQLYNAQACFIIKWSADTNTFQTWNQYHADSPAGKSPAQEREPLTRYPFTEQVIDSARPMLIQKSDPNLDATIDGLLESAQVASLLLLPLMFKDQIIGLIQVTDLSNPQNLSEEQLKMGQRLANHIAVAIEQAQTYREVEQRVAELEAVYKASLGLTTSLDLETVLHSILESTLQLVIGAQDTHIFLYDEDRLRFGAALWADGRKGKPWLTPRPEGLTYAVARKGKTIVIPDMRAHPLFEKAPPDWIGSIVGLPLNIGKRVVGVMTVSHPNPQAFTDENFDVLRLLGDQAAIAIENARLHNLVKKQARTDVLTSLPNRRALDEFLRKEILRSSRYNHTFTIVMVDLDNYKQVNDTYGHIVGDHVLEKIGQCLADCVRETDFLARYGGDEFVLVLPETNPITTEIVLDKLRHRISDCNFEDVGADDLRLGLSSGISTFPADGTTSDELIKIADAALYKDKR